MKPHQERVVAEKAELDAKLEKLAVFIGVDERWMALPAEEKDRLTRQLNAMQAYSAVLCERIAAFVDLP